MEQGEQLEARLPDALPDDGALEIPVRDAVRRGARRAPAEDVVSAQACVIVIVTNGACVREWPWRRGVALLVGQRLEMLLEACGVVCGSELRVEFKAGCKGLLDVALQRIRRTVVVSSVGFDV
jgi:hypothetical protein